MSTRILSANGMIGAKVKARDGEDIGEVHDFMIDLTSGVAVYVVLYYRGFLGGRDRYFVVPMANQQIKSASNGHIVMDVKKDALKNAIGFNATNRPRLSSPEFAQSIYELYGYQPGSVFRKQTVN